ncbi:class I SAM-dependent methyltransferase [Candidatus Woesearchaeota archaeon]|nr:class I SAM-dependent methyltransferase [Candidatus Woesearchaeota archaeon]
MDYSWSEYAKHYDRATPHTSFYIDLSRLIENFIGCGLVLDAGCATGILSARLAESGRRRVVAMDACEDMLVLARQKISERNKERLEVIRGDVQNIPFSDSTFDAAVCVNVLFDLEDPLLGLTEMYRAIKPGGLLAISCPRPDFSPDVLINQAISDYKHKGILDDLLDDLDYMIKFNRGKIPRQVYSLVELECMLEDVGFHNKMSFERVYADQSYLIVTEK